MKVVLNRLVDTGKETLGVLTIHDEIKECFSCKTLELSWKDNKTNVSCIPRGEYLVIVRFSEKHGEHFIIKDVEDRDYILIHAANYHSQLRGCIAVGKSYSDINKDGELDVTSSRDAMDSLLAVLPDSFYINII
tara:strand:+ start:15911 stop:16312 length:402 start_codon:yes stop_codon:yes gene_type:complete